MLASKETRSEAVIAGTKCPCTLTLYDDDLARDRKSVQDLPVYAYDHLEKNQIRLFYLLGQAPITSVQGYCTTIDLSKDSETPPYYALSYTWGDGEACHAIRVDKHQLLVSCNLYSALHRLRFHLNGETLPLFVDAICINQSKKPEWLAERAVQVRMMGAVYSRAKNVFINLGDEPLHGMKEMLDWFEEINDPNYWKLPEQTSKAWSAFLSLCQQDWWRRIWVLQEYILARRPVFMLGGRLILDQQLTGAITKFYEKNGVHISGKLSMDFRPPFNFIDTTTRFRRNLEASRQELQCNSLLWALSGTQQFKARDERDRVYATLGLVRDIDISSFTIDYTESLQGLSRRLSRFLICNCPTSMFFYNLSSIDVPGLPSWMVNLANPRKRCGFELSVGSADLPSKHRAGGSAPIQPKLNESSNVLTLKGVVIDTISAISEPYPSYPSDVSSGDEAQTALRNIALTWDDHTLQFLRDQFILERPNSTLVLSESDQVLKDYRRTMTAGGYKFSHFDKLLDPDITNWHRYRNDRWLNSGYGTLPSAVVLSTWKVVYMMWHYCESKCVGLTTGKKLCLIPNTAQAGDSLVLFRGFPTPFLMRQDSGRNRLLGAAYVHGVMDGELIALLNQKEMDIEIH